MLAGETVASYSSKFLPKTMIRILATNIWEITERSSVS